MKILSLILMIALWLLPIVIKSVRQKKQMPTPVMSDEDEDEMLENQSMQEYASDFQNYEDNEKKEEGYFTYDSEDFIYKNSPGNDKSEDEKSLRITEIDDEQEVSLTLEREELVKGIIYSEILKRKIN